MMKGLSRVQNARERSRGLQDRASERDLDLVAMTQCGGEIYHVTVFRMLLKHALEAEACRLANIWLQKSLARQTPICQRCVSPNATCDA